VWFGSEDLCRINLSQGKVTRIKWRQIIARMEENALPKGTVSYKLMARRFQGRPQKVFSIRSRNRLWLNPCMQQMNKKKACSNDELL
jgi:hypothetical protein